MSRFSLHWLPYSVENVGAAKMGKARAKLAVIAFVHSIVVRTLESIASQSQAEAMAAL